MSTRAQIVVEGNEGVKIYKHSDGYPEGVLPTLKKLLPAFKAGRGFDATYLAAHVSAAFIVDSLEGMKAFYRRMAKQNPDNPRYKAGHNQGFLGHGLGTDWHGDIEFIYHIKADFSVEVYKTRAHTMPMSSTTLDHVWTLDGLVKTKKFE